MGLADQQRIHVQLLAAAIFASPFLLAEVKLTITSKPSNTFDPKLALGAGIDGHEEGEIAQKLSPENVARMRSAGLKPLSYRLRTELAGEAWHWNLKGTWSDAEHSQGYWTGDAKPGPELILSSNGYRLPRRGNTIDQANDDGYSRIDDGDTDSFWKSNPYLGDRQQWVVVDLARSRRINTVRIEWGTPRAVKFHYEYSNDPYIDLTSGEKWLPLPDGTTQRARWLRIALEQSSGGPSPDWRDRTGFAIRELRVGHTDGGGHFTDLIHHASSRRRQTVIWVSSTDPWHRETDRDPNIEQPGIDLVYRSGLANGLPVLLSIPVLYDTPENAAAFLTYVYARGYPVTDVELGEEPEEQFTTAEDYGTLSRKAIKAVRAAGHHPRFGGPSLILLPPKLTTDASWMARLYRYYLSVDSLDALGFFSFEWYPFDDVCADSSKQLTESASLLADALGKIETAGIPHTLPWFMTEYGFSAYGAQAEVELPGALFNAESVALFLSFGGARTFLYGYEPGELLHDRSCTWGNNMLFLGNQRTATYWAAQIISQDWVTPEGGLHGIFPTSTDSEMVSAYALRNSAGELSLLLLNKSQSARESVSVPFQGSFHVTRFSRAQYTWLSAGEHGRITKSEPPEHTTQSANSVELPPYSLTVLRGRTNP